MRKFKTHAGAEVDLDDPKTYKSIKAKTIGELTILLHCEIGRSIFYMNYLNPSKYTYFTNWDARTKIDHVIKSITRSYKKNCMNKKWLKEKIFLLNNANKSL